MNAGLFTCSIIRWPPRVFPFCERNKPRRRYFAVNSRSFRFCFISKRRAGGLPEAARWKLRSHRAPGPFSRNRLCWCRFFAPVSECSTESSGSLPTPRSVISVCIATPKRCGRKLLRRIPVNAPAAEVLLLDPMLATGNSASEAASILKAQGATSIQFLCIVACPPGIEQFHREHSDIPIVAAAIDPQLDDRDTSCPD